MTFSDSLLQEIKRVPQVEDILILDVSDNNTQLDALAHLPQLKSLSFGQCRNTNRLLEKLPELLDVTDFSLYSCYDFSGDDLIYLQRLPNLSTLYIHGDDAPTEFSLEFLAPLLNLKWLHLCLAKKPLSETDVTALSKLTRLEYLCITRVEITQEQTETLKQMLPEAYLEINGVTVAQPEQIDEE